MRYLLLIYASEDMGDAPEPTPEEQAVEMKRWFDYTDDLQRAGVLEGGEALQPVATATTVRRRDDRTLTVDGPFAETKEVLGGYYLIDVDDLDDAVEWAARCPGAEHGSIELRPIAELPPPPDGG